MDANALHANTQTIQMAGTKYCRMTDKAALNCALELNVLNYS